MPQRIEAYGQTLEFPDGMSDDDMLKHIRANEPELNPDYKQPLRDKINDLTKGYLAVDIGNKYELAKKTPIDKSDPNYDEFTDPDNFKSQNPEGFSGLAGNILTGAKQTGRMVEAAINTVINDRGRVEQIAKESSKSAEKYTPLEQRALLGDLKQIDREQGAFGQIGDTLKAAANNPMGTGQMVTEQLPNTAVSLGARFVGFKTGVAAGSVFGPVGATIGGVLGYVGGMFLGNVLLEAGGKAIEKASDEDGFTPQDSDAALREGAIKATVLTGVETATFKLGGMLSKKLGSEAINAGARAEAKTLIDAGIDVTSLTAINTALRASPELFKTAKVAGERAAIQSLSIKKKAAILGTGVGLETIGEFTGEAGGEYAATGKADYVDATIEALSSSTMSVAETAYNYNKVASGNDMSAEGIQKAASGINDADTKAGIDNINKSKTVDEAIKAANDTVSAKPINKEDILKSVDPSLADIERLTGLKPSEAIQEQERILRESSIPVSTDKSREATFGHDTEIVLPDNTSVKAQWRVVDADQLAASMKEDVNQPRDRSSVTSDIQIKSIANSPDYRRLSDSPVMDVGAPVVDQNGRMIDGFGRSIGLIKSYDQGTSNEYLDKLRIDAISKGIDLGISPDISKPILIRQLTEPVDTRKLAIASNSGMTLQMSELEQAKLDSERMKGIENFDVNDSGDISLTSKNITQLKDSLGSYTSTELGSLTDKSGQLSQEGVKRVRNAMLAKAYGNSTSLEKLVESTDSDMRNVLGALTKSAGHIINTKGDTKALLEAVDTYTKLKATGQPVDNFMAQQDAFSDGLSKEASNILKFIDSNARSQKKLTDFFKGNFREVDTTSADMFDKTNQPEILKDERITKLEKHLKDSGYDFTVEPASVRDINALGSAKKARKELAEKQAKIFKKKIVFVKADGPFNINGVMVPDIKDTIFVDIRTDKPFDAIMAHELSHWMEQEKPEVYKSMLRSLKKVIKEDATEGYAAKYGIDGSTKAELTKEIAADIMGDNFTEQSFWNKVSEANPKAFKDIAESIIRWLKGVILKAKSNGMGSDQWVKDATKAQDIIAKAVAQYAVDENSSSDIKDSKPKFSNKETLPETSKTLFDRFADLGAEKGSVIQSLSDAKKITGLGFRIPIKSANLDDRVPANLDANDGVIYYNKNWDFSKEFGAQYIAEELFHALDVVSDGKTISASSERLNTVDGDIYLESKKNFEDNGKYKWYLEYPVNDKNYTDLSSHTRQAELFARLGVLYSGDLDIMKDQLPLAYEAYHGIFRARRIGINGEVSRKVWSFSNAYSPMGSKHGAASPNVSGDTRLSGIRGDSDLEEIRKVIAKEFKANPEGKKVLFSKEEPKQPKLYSKLEQSLESASDKIFSTGPQVKLWLQSNAGKLGIKKDEIYWSGIDNWLDAQGKVTKQQVVEFARNNGVKVEDITLDANEISKGDVDKYIDDHNGYVDSDDDGIYHVYLDDKEINVDDHLVYMADASEALSNYARKLMNAQKVDSTKKTKHSKPPLTLPGGKYYKELVVTVPTIEPHNADDTTHFGDTGQGKQIGWIRMDTRDNGLFIEELQSQRAQQGRSNGFKGEYKGLPKGYSLVDEGTVGEDNIQSWSIQRPDGSEVGMGALIYGTHEQAENHSAVMLENSGDLSAEVPPAPFVSDSNNKATNAYITLLMKKAVIEAVSNNHDSVSWTTGGQQADRYDLSKQISRITYDDNNSGGVGKPDLTGAIDRGTLRAYNLDGDKVIDKYIYDTKEIEAYVGKDAAHKLVNTEGVARSEAGSNFRRRTLSGLDLKVGGEWAQSMYGNEHGLNLQGKPSLMSQSANDIFKHVGSGKVESINGQPGFHITQEMKKTDLPLFSVQEPQQPKKFNPNEDIPETKARQTQRVSQDKFNRFTVINEFLAKEKGIKLSENADVYKAEERYYGKVANAQEDFRDKVRNPLIEKIAKAGFKLPQVEEYLEMRHAQEANAQNRKLTGKEDSTAYGISDQEAKDYLAKAPKELAKLADEVQAITKATQQLRLDNGLETQERVDAMNGAYKYYIPVRGDAESQEKQSGGKGTGQGFGLKYKGKRRLGHEARNEAAIENIFQDYERAIIQVEKNRAGKSLALMAAEIQMPELISINQPVKRKVLKNDTAYTVEHDGHIVGVFNTIPEAQMAKKLFEGGLFEGKASSNVKINRTNDQRLIYSASPMLADNEVLVYIDGHEIRMQINDDLLARAYKNMGVEALGHILSAGRAINGWMSKVYTGYNPEFILTNLQRDFQSGIINLTGEQGITIAAKAVANYPKSFATLLKYAITGKSTEWIDAYRDNGGNTGAAYLPDLERVAQDVKLEYAAYQGVIANLKEGDSANALRAAGRKAFNATLKYIEHLNQAGENAFRLATFKAMVDSGKSVKEAASMSKNVTVNFNRKGEIGAEMNAMYLFFNASVQGTAAVSHALFKGRHKYQAWGLVGGMMSVGYMMASALGGFDDEDKYDEISDSTKSRNLIMSYGDGYLKIPVPYGHGFFYNAGRMYAEAQRKGDLGKMPYQLMALATEEFSPFNVASTEEGEFNSKKVLYGLLPTTLRIPTEITNNFSAFTGREMYPEKSWYKSEPDNEKMWRGTKGTVYDVSAQYLEAIGVEISPEVLKSLTRTVTGGSGAFVDSTVSGALLKKEGAELDTREIPFVRKMYGETTIQDVRARFGKAKDEVVTAKEKLDAAKRSNDISSVEKVLDDKKELLELNGFANKTSEVIKIFRDEQDSVKLSDKYTTAEKRLKIKELEKQEEGFYRIFLDDYKKIDRSKLK